MLTEKRDPYTRGVVKPVTQLPSNPPLIPQNPSSLNSLQRSATANPPTSTRKLPTPPVKIAETSVPTKTIPNASLNPSMDTSRPSSMGIASLSAQAAQRADHKKEVPMLPKKPTTVPNNTNSPVISNSQPVKPESTKNKSLFKSLLGPKEKKVKLDPSVKPKVQKEVKVDSHLNVQNGAHLSYAMHQKRFAIFKQRIKTQLIRHDGGDQLLNKFDVFQQHALDASLRMMQPSYMMAKEDVKIDLERVFKTYRPINKAYPELGKDWEKTGLDNNFLKLFLDEVFEAVQLIFDFEDNYLKTGSWEGREQKAIDMYWALARARGAIEAVKFFNENGIPQTRNTLLSMGFFGKTRIVNTSSGKQEVPTLYMFTNDLSLRGKFTSRETGALSDTWFPGAAQIELLSKEEAKAHQDIIFTHQNNEEIKGIIDSHYKIYSDYHQANKARLYKEADEGFARELEYFAKALEELPQNWKKTGKDEEAMLVISKVIQYAMFTITAYKDDLEGDVWTEEMQQKADEINRATDEANKYIEITNQLKRKDSF